MDRHPEDQQKERPIAPMPEAAENPAPADGAPAEGTDGEAASPPEAAFPPGLEGEIAAAISTVYDPEIPVNIYEMGLIYGIDIGDDSFIRITMTLTSPACPVAGILPGQVESVVGAVPGVAGVEVELVWDPPWTPEMMTEAAKLELGMV